MGEAPKGGVFVPTILLHTWCSSLPLCLSLPVLGPSHLWAQAVGPTCSTPGPFNSCQSVPDRLLLTTGLPGAPYRV